MFPGRAGTSFALASFVRKTGTLPLFPRQPMWMPHYLFGPWSQIGTSVELFTRVVWCDPRVSPHWMAPCLPHAPLCWGGGKEGVGLVLGPANVSEQEAHRLVVIIWPHLELLWGGKVFCHLFLLRGRRRRADARLTRGS